MTSMTRTIDVSVENGIEQSATDIEEAFWRETDDAFANDVVEVTNVVGENPEAGPGHLSFETDADPEAMALEAEFMLDTAFLSVTATVAPTDEEIQEALEHAEF